MKPERAINFIVYAPGDYSPNGGGSVALHKLAHNIAAQGEQCFIMTSKKNPDYLGIQIDEAKAKEMAGYVQSMVIYPEVICGNPLGSPHVMRWILYFVRTKGDHGNFGANDLIYKYAPIFTLRNPQPVTGELRAMELNLDIFTDRGQARAGSCYLKKKNPDKHNIHPAGCLCIDDYPMLGGNAYLADVFNQCETFYAYDDATWLSVMAALCGCKSIVIPKEGLTAKDWYNGYPYFSVGIAYGERDLNYAEATRNLLIGNLLKLEQESIEQTLAFIAKAKEVMQCRA